MTGKHSGHAAIRNNRQPSGNEFDELSEKFGWEFPGQQPLPDDEVTIAEFFKPTVTPPRQSVSGAWDTSAPAAIPTGRVLICSTASSVSTRHTIITRSFCGGTTQKKYCRATIGR